MPNSIGLVLLRRALTLAAIVISMAVVAETVVAQTPWRLVEELRIGTGDAEPYSFTDIRGLAVGTGGQIFVLDFKVQEIRAFDASGKFLRLLSRRGGGPGEISSANGLQQAPDGTIWVNDPANSRFSLFAPDGSFLRQHVVPISGYGFIWWGMVDTRGRVNDPIYASDARNERRSRLRRYPASGAPVDTVDVPCGQSGSPSPVWRAKRAKGSMVMDVPFVPTPQVILDPRGFVWCTPATVYRIVRARLGPGDTVAVIERKVAAVPIPAAERDAAIARADSAIKRYETSDADYSQVPKLKPFISALDVDDSGRLWVRRPTNEPNSTTFDVFDARGRFLATATAPFKISDHWHPVIRGDVMYTVALDEDDVQNVVRARIRR